MIQPYLKYVNLKKLVQEKLKSVKFHIILVFNIQNIALDQ